MRAVALALTLSLVSAGCFPENPRARTISKITEGGLAVAGVVMETVANVGHTCGVSTPGEPDSGCDSPNSGLTDVGLVLILAGIVGFVATISTTPDDKAAPVVIKADPVPVVAPAPAPLPAPAPMPAPTR